MIGEGESAEDADGTAIAEGPPMSDDTSPGRPATSFADPGAQTEGIQL
jgi:hypothetical protein